MQVRDPAAQASVIRDVGKRTIVDALELARCIPTQQMRLFGMFQNDGSYSTIFLPRGLGRKRNTSIYKRTNNNDDSRHNALMPKY